MPNGQYWVLNALTTNTTRAHPELEGGRGVETERRAQAFRREFIDIRHEIIGSALKLRELYVQELEEFIRARDLWSKARFRIEFHLSSTFTTAIFIDMETILEQSIIGFRRTHLAVLS
ncbi:hypothetical protein P5673_001859 [Acropora cervicornis]|uniref:Uncharacterized protein n=1 Tax=Acropora cervicornis TaxID=6130 RepID=A0AAD9R4D9_ACRCE|nr:hypothetical protein P5673_001859 [Acropora cervicornis]